MKRFFGYLSASLAVLFVLVSTLPAAAAGSAGLSITPRKDYVINPGQTINDKLTIGNLSGQSDLDITLKMIDFTFTDQSGTPKLFLADQAPQTAWSLKPFTTLPKNVVVPAGKTATVNYSITIPKNMGAGSYYSAILYQAGGGTGNNVALNASGVSLVFVSVPGIVHEKMTVQKFGAYVSDNNGVTGSFVSIATSAPQMMAFSLKNEGNVAESPAGSIIVKDMFGHEIKTINKTNANSSLALIGQTRLFTTCIKTVQQKIQLEGGTSTNTSCTNPNLMPGRYTASLDVFYGQNGNPTHEITATASFWYLPWWFIIAVIVILLLIIGGIWRLQRKIRGVSKGGSGRKNGIRRR